MKYIKTFEQFLNESLLEKDAIKATQDQIAKAMKKADKFASKAAAARYDVKFKQDKLEYEKTKDKYQNDVDKAKDGVQRETEKAALKGLTSQWKDTKNKYKERLKNMR
jgi:hypothetical protein